MAEIAEAVTKSTNPGQRLIDTGLLLVNMPFASIKWPSIQIGLLAAIAEKAGFRVDTAYPNLEFAHHIGAGRFEVLSDVGRVRLGEWIFAKAAFPDHPKRSDFPEVFSETVDEVAREAGMERDTLVSIHETLAPQFIESYADALIDQGFRAVGFTSTFEQNVASIALAKALKRRDASIITLFGGSNFDGEMGLAYIRGIEEIDVMVSGEADSVLPMLLDALANDDPMPDAPGVVTRKTMNRDCAPRATFTGAMDDLPTPQYDDFFRTLGRYSLNPVTPPVSLPIESSRGCWWGEKHHCTFCGLNGMGMSYRNKSPSMIIDDIQKLSERYRLNRFFAVDNIIGVKMMEDLTRELGDKQFDYQLFYEIKANLTREKIRSMRNGGITGIQPGIESLSSHVLKLMDKGIRGIHNVQVLKWMTYYEVETFWNLLHGFPGELDEDYTQQADWMKSLHHIIPPTGMIRIWLERFSPNFNRAKELGFRNVHPDKSYQYVYPESVDLNSAAYFFEYEAPNSVKGAPIIDCMAEVKRWRDKWADSEEQKPFLTYLRTHGGIRILDGREDPAEPRTFVFSGVLAKIYLLCDEKAMGFGAILDALDVDRDDDAKSGRTKRMLDRLVDQRLMIEEGRRYLSLALPNYSAH